MAWLPNSHRDTCIPPDFSLEGNESEELFDYNLAVDDGLLQSDHPIPPDFAVDTSFLEPTNAPRTLERTPFGDVYDQTQALIPTASYTHVMEDMAAQNFFDMGPSMLQTGSAIAPEVTEDFLSMVARLSQSLSGYSHEYQQSSSGMFDDQDANFMSWLPFHNDPEDDDVVTTPQILRGPSYQHDSVSLQHRDPVLTHTPYHPTPTIWGPGQNEMVFREDVVPIPDPQFDLGHDTFQRERLIALGYKPEETEYLVKAQTSFMTTGSSCQHDLLYQTQQPQGISSLPSDVRSMYAQPDITHGAAFGILPPAQGTATEESLHLPQGDDELLRTTDLRESAIDPNSARGEATHTSFSLHELHSEKRKRSSEDSKFCSGINGQISILPDAKRSKAICPTGSFSESAAAPIARSSLRPLLPLVDSNRELSANSTSSKGGAVPDSKPVLTTEKSSCMFCRCKNGNHAACENNTGDTTCSCCRDALNLLQMRFGFGLPNLEITIFLATDNLIQFMDGLRRGVMFLSDQEAFGVAHKSIVCHFEPHRPQHAPTQMSNRNVPIGLVRHDTEAGGYVNDLDYSLHMESMHRFMRIFAKGMLPPDLRNINNGAIYLATQFISWYGILSNLEENKIFQASNVSTVEAKHCLQIILFSTILALEDILQSIRLNLNASTANSLEAKENLCSVWAIYRFMNHRRKEMKKKAPPTMGGFGLIIHNLEQHILRQTDILLPILQKFKNHYGPYYCFVERLEELRPYIKLIDLQPQLRPLLNITIERHDPVALHGFSPNIYEARSCSHVLNATGSALEAHVNALLEKLQLGSEPAEPRRITGPNKKLTAGALSELQAELGYCYSSAQLERGVDMAMSEDADPDSNWKPVTLERIGQDMLLPIEEFAGVESMWTFEVPGVPEGLAY